MTEDIKEVAQTKPANNYLIPLAIVVAGGLIAGAVVMNNGKGGGSPLVINTGEDTKVQQEPVGATDNVRAVTSEDHVKGSPDAQVVIVEYSDYECPFCKSFHSTMNRVIEEVGDSGEVAWVFRHFPLQQLHPRNAAIVAVASECAVEQGGNDMFWRFSDRFMELTPSNDRTDLATVFPQIYGEIGLNRVEMEACIESQKYNSHVEDDLNNAIATGGRGTPWSVVIAPNGKTFPLNGAQPFESVMQLIEIAKKEQ